MKNKKIFKKITCMFFVIICILSCFNFTAFADDGNYGDAPPQNIIPLPNGTGPTNKKVIIPYDNQNADTLVFLMDYVQYLYSYNMTNGQKPFLIVCLPNYVQVFCTSVVLDYAYVNSVELSGNYIYFRLTTGTTGSSSNHDKQYYQSWTLRDFGNFSINDATTSTNLMIATNTVPSADYISYIYLNQDGTYSYYAYSSSTSGVFAPLVQMYLNMKDFIEQIGVSLPGLSANTTLDIGSIISAVMSAPMIIFGGLTGSPGNLSQSLELFGIDIRATLISLLVIAIVIFIIKFLRGG